MGIIKLLDEEVSQLIAAGEVVERPSSVVKELVENSIDAGASKVTIEIRHGGVTMIRVSDNGSGIAPEDVPVMFLRHATSKVRTQEDLGHIATLGFRGEAMASIHAVARVEVLTRKQDSDEGVCYRGEGAQTGQVQPAGCPAGTTVKVQDLFYNTPARMKFLKKDVQEGNAVAGIAAGTVQGLSTAGLSYLSGAYGLGGLMAGVFSPLGKFAVAVAFVISNGIASLQVNSTSQVC